MKRPYITLEITIGDETIVISKTSVYRLLQGGVSGIEAAEFEAMFTDYAAMDGGYYEGIKVKPRPISIRFAVDDKNQTERLRKKLISFFSPRAPGTLVVDRGDRRRKIGFRLANTPEFVQDNIIEDRLHVTVDMLCPDPYFEDEEATTYRFRQATGLLTFPFNSVGGVGITSGALVTSDTMTLVNSGDVPVGIVCDILAAGGSVTNPRISMNGEYVRAITVLGLNSTLKIDTNKGRKNLYVNGESRFIFDRKSIFFQLPAGESTIVVSADAGISDAEASFTYAFKYLGA